MKYAHNFELPTDSSVVIPELCGQENNYLRWLEMQYGVEIHHRGLEFFITGEKAAVQQVTQIIEALHDYVNEHHKLDLPLIHLLSKQIMTNFNDKLQRAIHLKQCKIEARTNNQQDYLNKIANSVINFGVGPAGTGKTYLAVASAVSALEQQTVERLLLVRPAVEAGERLGFLPGDMAQKIDPYLRPLYDALFEMLGIEQVNRLLEKQIIEIAPLAYMRGRTLNSAFIILDEAQNTTESQMKMFLTRIGFNSKAIITGDLTQIDLPRGVPSGLKQALLLLENIPGISMTQFEAHDTVRHPLVEKVILAYQQANANSTSL